MRVALVLQGVAGAMLKQTRPSKFRVPMKYVDLSTGEELAMPEVLQRQSSVRLPSSLPFKVIQRRQRLQMIKKSNAELQTEMSSRDSEKQSTPKQPAKSLVSLDSCYTATSLNGIVECLLNFMPRR